MTGPSSDVAPFPLDALLEGFFCFHSRRIDTLDQHPDIERQDYHPDYPAHGIDQLVPPPRDHQDNQHESRQTEELADVQISATVPKTVAENEKEVKADEERAQFAREKKRE